MRRVGQGEEHGSYIIEPETGRRYRGCFNVVNNNSISQFAGGLHCGSPPVMSTATGFRFPASAICRRAAAVRASVWVRASAVEAAVRGDIHLLKQAALVDPPTSAVATRPRFGRWSTKCSSPRRSVACTARLSPRQRLFARRSSATDDYRGAIRYTRKSSRENGRE